MKRTTYLAIALGLLLTATALWAEPTSITYYVGFDNNQPKYNDLMFSLSGTGLTVHAPGGKPYDSTQRAGAFWDGDGGKNIGDYLYGTGQYSNAGAVAPNAQFWAGNRNNKALDRFWFSVPDNTSVTLAFGHLNDTYSLYYYSTNPGGNHPGSKQSISFDPTTKTAKFSATGSFGLEVDWGKRNAAKSSNKDGGNYYAVFQADNSSAPTPNPEPGTLALLGSGLLGVAGVVRRKLNR